MLACSICCYFFEAKLIKIYDGWHSTSWYFLKVFQILYPITCKCKFHADGQTSTHRNVTDLPPSWCIFTPDIQYIFVVLEAFNSHTRRFWLLHAMYSSYICAQQRTTTLQKPYFLQLERRLFLSLFFGFTFIPLSFSKCIQKSDRKL